MQDSVKKKAPVQATGGSGFRYENAVAAPISSRSSRRNELELRDEAEIHVKYKGLSIPILIDKCHANRFDLDEGDRRRIESLKESGRRYVTGGQMGWFKRICKQLGEIETHM